TLAPWRKGPPRVSLRLDERQTESVWIDERQRPPGEPPFHVVHLDAVALQALAPEVEALRADLERDLYRKSMPHSWRSHLRPREERHIGAGVTLGVGIEEMIGARVVLIDTLLDEPHAEYTCVEVQVLLGRAGNRRNVMKAVDVPHVRSYTSLESQP